MRNQEHAQTMQRGKVMTHAYITPIRVDADQVPWEDEAWRSAWEEAEDEQILFVDNWMADPRQGLADYIEWLEANEHTSTDIAELPTSLGGNA